MSEWAELVLGWEECVCLAVVCVCLLELELCLVLELREAWLCLPDELECVCLLGVEL